MVGACLLFVLPVDWRARRFTITWDEALKIDWGIVFLYGGGLAMGALAFETGLAEAMGRGITSLPAVAVHRLAHDAVHGHGDRPVGNHVEHRRGEHDHSDRDRGVAGRRRAADRAGARRDARRQHGLHDAGLDAAERDRLQLGLHPDHQDDALRRDARRGRLLRDRRRSCCCSARWCSSRPQSRELPPVRDPSRSRVPRLAAWREDCAGA